MKPTGDELQLFDDITRLTEDLWKETADAAFLNSDPRAFSCVLFKRLRGHHRGFGLLWLNRHALEADIILRSGIEASICLAANYVLKDGFIRLLKQDAVATIQGQIKVQRDDLGGGFTSDAEAMLRHLRSELRGDEKAAKLNWQTLAEQGEVPQLYNWHRMLSGLSSHITGLSIITGFASTEADDVAALQNRMHFNMMAGATLMGAMRHAGMLDSLDHAQRALDLFDRMAVVSMLWN